MFGLLVMEVMYLSGHPSIINKICTPILGLLHPAWNLPSTWPELWIFQRPPEMRVIIHLSSVCLSECLVLRVQGHRN